MFESTKAMVFAKSETSSLKRRDKQEAENHSGEGIN